jgi:hypothetical protein
MSAFMVDDTHIDALLTAGLLLDPRAPLRWWIPGVRELTAATADRVGAMLLAENRRSVNHRYREDEIESIYQFHQLAGRPDPVVVLSAIDCYEYQACEHPEWERSEAWAFCDALRRLACRHLPGYEAAPWEITDPTVFLARTATGDRTGRG